MLAAAIVDTSATSLLAKVDDGDQDRIDEEFFAIVRGLRTSTTTLPVRRAARSRPRSAEAPAASARRGPSALLERVRSPPADPRTGH